MIDNKLKKKILPNLKMELSKNEWIYIEEMFSEVYLTNEYGYDIVSLKPPSNYNPLPGQMKLTIQFYALNGAYYAVDDWESVKQRGVKL